jgi:hypothetical protein
LELYAGGMALGLVYLKGINPLRCPAKPIFSKKAMGLTSPPKGGMGLAVVSGRTCRPRKTGLEELCIVW